MYIQREGTNCLVEESFAWKLFVGVTWGDRKTYRVRKRMLYIPTSWHKTGGLGYAQIC